MQIGIDEHVKMTLEFMQVNIPESKLIGVADAVPKMARLLWDRYPQVDLIPCFGTKLSMIFAKVIGPLFL